MRAAAAVVLAVASAATPAELTCSFAELGFESKYTNLTGAAAVAAGHALSEAQRRAYASLFRKMDRGEPIFWLGVGGSFFGGRKCADKKNVGGARCSYSYLAGAFFSRAFPPDRKKKTRYQLASFLREQKYNITINDDASVSSDASSGLAYRNVAMSGVTTGGILPSLPSILKTRYVDGMTPDLLMLDFSTNDDGEKQDWGAADQARKEAGAMTAGAAVDRDGEVLAATEALVRYVLSAWPDLAVVLVEGFCYATWTRDVKEEVGARYGVPVVPAAALFAEPCARCWRGGPQIKHQPYWAHERLARGLRAWWCAFRRRVLSEPAGRPAPLPAPVAPPALRDRFQVCDDPLAVYDALALEHAAGGGGARPAVVNGNWTLYADRPEKPGWIADGDRDTIEFPLKFGASPRIMIVFTQGYEGFDDATVTMPDVSPNHFTLAGTHRARVTQSELLLINAKQDANEQLVGGVKGFGVAPHSTHTLRIAKNSDRGKVKVTWVSSC